MGIKAQEKDRGQLKFHKCEGINFRRILPKFHTGWNLNNKSFAKTKINEQERGLNFRRNLLKFQTRGLWVNKDGGLRHRGMPVMGM